MQDVRFDNGSRNRQPTSATLAVMDAAWIRKKFVENPEKKPADLARATGLTAVQISKIMGGTRGIKAAEAARITQFFNVQDNDLRGMLDAPRVFAGQDAIPVMGTASGGPDGEVVWNDEVIDRVARPPSLQNVSGGYALYVVNDSMSPRYMPGELLYLHPNKPVPLGGFAVFQLKGRGESVRAVVKQLKKRTATGLILFQFNPEKEIPVSLTDVIAMHRVVGSGEG